MPTCSIFRRRKKGNERTQTFKKRSVILDEISGVKKRKLNAEQCIALHRFKTRKTRLNCTIQS